MSSIKKRFSTVVTAILAPEHHRLLSSALSQISEKRRLKLNKLSRLNHTKLPCVIRLREHTPTVQRYKTLFHIDCAKTDGCKTWFLDIIIFC